MVKQFEIKCDYIDEIFIITRVKYSQYYKVIIEGKKSRTKKVKKIKNFDELLIEFSKLAMKTAYLETKVNELEKNKNQ